jgi:stage II sporulation protein GA (sporulation sigma-E factor processing peptidase)
LRGPVIVLTFFALRPVYTFHRGDMTDAGGIPDSLFLINLVINYIMLLVTAKICAGAMNRLRLLGAAVLGAVYSVAVVLPETPFLRSPVLRVAVGLLMVLAAFGGKPRVIRHTLVFFAVSASFGGAVMAASF